MLSFPPTLILRHRKENLKKCSLRGLENRSDMCFYTYPLKAPLPDLSQYAVLTLDAPPLTASDAHLGLFLIDATWRYAPKMAQALVPPYICRSLPATIQTAYPRRQDDCPDPARGLASIEALYIAYHILGRDPSDLLNYYYWKDDFLNHLNSNYLATTKSEATPKKS